jgi:propionyl-CoA synthetase
MGCFSDIGWVVSHSYTLYGPLLTGAATVLYEGKPVGTPDASAFWRLVDEYKINSLFTAPTALRAIRKEDPNNSHLASIGKRGGLRSLRALFLAGERSEPAIITMYQDLLKTYGAENSQVVDNWWSSESGSPISGIALVPHAGKSRTTGMKEDYPPLDIKPGSAGKAMPGFDVRCVALLFPPNYLGTVLT